MTDALSTDPKSPIPNLPTLLNEIQPLLSLILSIPPIDPTTYLRISCLLSFTSTIREMIIGYPIITAPRIAAVTEEDDPAQSGKALLDRLFDFLDDLDEGWQAVLLGEVYDSVSRSRRSREGSWREATVGMETGMEVDDRDGEDGGARFGVGMGLEPGRVRQVMIGKEMSVTDK